MPSHYTRLKIQPTEYIVANKMDFLEGNVIKYISRYRFKDGINDLKKARQYIDWLIEREETGEIIVERRPAMTRLDRPDDFIVIQTTARKRNHGLVHIKGDQLLRVFDYTVALEARLAKLEVVREALKRERAARETGESAWQEEYFLAYQTLNLALAACEEEVLNDRS